MAVAVEMNFRGATLAVRPGDRKDGPHAQWCDTPGSDLPLDSQDGRRNPGRRRLGDRNAYDQYAQEKIGPYSAEAGITEAPETRTHDVHNHLTKD